MPRPRHVHARQHTSTHVHALNALVWVRFPYSLLDDAGGLDMFPVTYLFLFFVFCFFFPFLGVRARDGFTRSASYWMVRRE